MICLNDQQEFLVKKALSNLAEFARLYGDDESEELLSVINATIFKPKKPLKTILIKLSFSKLADSNVFSKYWRTHKFVSSGKDGHVVELKAQGPLQGASADQIGHLFFAASQLDEHDDNDDIDPSIIEACGLLKTGATFLGAVEDD